jgi:hypothetical protein
MVFHRIRKFLKRNAIVAEDIKISIIPQTASDVGTRLADEPALAQCRASYSEWSVSVHFCGFTYFEGTEIGGATDFVV